MRRKLARTNDYAQAGERYRTMPDWERDDLVANLIDLLGQCEQQIQERMVDHFAQCDPEYGRARRRGPRPARDGGSRSDRRRLIDAGIGGGRPASSAGQAGTTIRRALKGGSASSWATIRQREPSSWGGSTDGANAITSPTAQAWGAS